MILQGKDVKIEWSKLPTFIISNPLEYKHRCDDVLINRAKNITGTITVEFDQNMSSLEFLQKLKERPISVGYHDYFIVDDFAAWMPITKLLQSKSKQSRIVLVVIK